jgi:hypothetical protein
MHLHVVADVLPAKTLGFRGKFRSARVSRHPRGEEIGFLPH